MAVVGLCQFSSQRELMENFWIQALLFEKHFSENMYFFEYTYIVM